MIYNKSKYFWPVVLIIFFGNIFYTQMTPDKYNPRAEEIFKAINIPEGVILLEETHSRNSGNGALYTRKYTINDSKIPLISTLQENFRKNGWKLQSENTGKPHIIEYRIDNDWEIKMKIDKQEMYFYLTK